MEKIDKNLIDPSIEPESEKAHRIVRSILSTTPVFGGALVEAFSSIIEPPILKRKTEWMVQVTESLNQIIESRTNISIKDLSQNEEFVTTLIHASSIALKNHDKEKLNALKNAVLNTAIDNTVEEHFQILFINLIDSLSSLHFNFLNLLQAPNEWGNRSDIIFNKQAFDSYEQLIEQAFPNIENEVRSYVLKDLQSKSLVDIPMMDSKVEKLTTNLGDRFINYIKEIKT